MTAAQAILFAILIGLLAMLVWGKVRYDIVAFGALVVATIAGVVPAEDTFSGFGHPATAIVALVLVVSTGLTRAGAVDLLARHVVDGERPLAQHIGIMSGVAAALSSFMNNVAALTFLIPLDVQAAEKAKRSPAFSLMPISFASILGGMVTLIGTPPNIVIATFRDQALGQAFGMFDFAPVGLAVAVAGVAYVALIGWRLVPAAPKKQTVTEDLRNLEGYLAELDVLEDSPMIDKRLRDFREAADEADISLLGIVREKERLPGGAANERVRRGDTIVVQGGPKAIEQFLGIAGLRHSAEKTVRSRIDGGLDLLEVVVPDRARMIGRSAIEMRLASAHRVFLLGISRGGKRFRERVKHLPVEVGDVLLLAGEAETLSGVAASFGWLPLADRGLHRRPRGMAWLAIGLFVAAIAAAASGFASLPVAVGFVALAFVAFKIVPLSVLYDTIEWPVIVLLGSLIPIGTALESTGGTALIADAIAGMTSGLPAVAVLAVLMVVTMTLSDVLNNVATALIAAPVAVDIAERLEVSPDPFLMGVAIAASCAFLTPIGHKNNIIVMGPGGYRFGDYWRMGLPLEVLVLAVSIPLLVFVWPLRP